MTAPVVHIRKRAGKSLARPGYCHRHVAQSAGGYRDPQADTLCGDKPTDRDQGWAETRWENYLTDVTCEPCKAARRVEPVPK